MEHLQGVLEDELYPSGAPMFKIKDDFNKTWAPTRKQRHAAPGIYPIMDRKW